MTNTADDARSLKRVDQLADLLDSKFTLPGTDIKFGVDAVLGLVPGGGDLVSYAASGALIVTMARHGASPLLVARMLINVALDAIVGSIPVLGTVFDVVYKANNRNVRLLREHYEEGKHTGSVWPVVIGAIVVLLLIGAFVSYLAYVVLSWLWGLLTATA